MTRFITTLFTIVCLTTHIATCHAQPKTSIEHGKTDPRLKGYFTPAGVHLEIVADAPQVINPVGMTFGPDGTLYVLEWPRSKGKNQGQKSTRTFTYKDGSKQTISVMHRPVEDHVKVLVRSEDGTYDKAKVVLKDHLPSSLLIHDGYLYLSGQGTVRRYKMKGPHGPFGKPEIIAQGFGGYFHQQVSGLTLGPGGWLYITVGGGDHVVEGADGSRATVRHTGAVFRCRPDGGKLEVFARGLCNPYRDVVFDATGSMFHADNDGGTSAGCRLLHIGETVDFGWRLGKRTQKTGIVPPMLNTGRGGPAGLFIYNDTFFPEPFRGVLFYPDVVRQSIRGYRLQPAGATFKATQSFDLLTSKDPLFRPCQMILGPDGVIYVCDWRADLSKDDGWGNGTHGRIYRLRWSGTEKYPESKLRDFDSWAKIRQQPTAKLLETLSSDNASDRFHAQQALRGQGDENRKKLLGVIQAFDQSLAARIAAMEAVQAFWDKSVSEVFVELLTYPNPDLRRLAANALAEHTKRGDQRMTLELLRVLNERNPAVLRVLALAMGRIQADGAADSLVNLLKEGEREDRYLQDALVRAIERQGKAGMTSLLNLSNSGDSDDLDLVVRTFLAFRSRPAAAALPSLLKNYHLTEKQHIQLLRSYRNYQLAPPVSLGALVDHVQFLLKQSKILAKKNPRKHLELKYVQLEALKIMTALDGKAAQKFAKLVPTWLADEKFPDVRQAVIDLLVTLDLKEVSHVLSKHLARTLPPEEQQATLLAVAHFREKSAMSAVDKLLADAGLKKTKAGQQVQAAALLAFARLDAKEAEQVAKRFLESPNLTYQQAAITVLGQQPSGAALIGRRFLAGRLAAQLRPRVLAVLSQHADTNAELGKLLEKVKAAKR